MFLVYSLCVLHISSSWPNLPSIKVFIDKSIISNISSITQGLRLSIQDKHEARGSPFERFPASHKDLHPARI